MNIPYDTHILQDGMLVILTQTEKDHFPVWVICDLDVVTDRMLEARSVPFSYVQNGDTPELAILHTWNHMNRVMSRCECLGLPFDVEPYAKAIAQLVEISNKPVEIWME